MKEGWSIRSFDDVLEIRNGKNQREVESESGIYPIYGSAGNVMGMAKDYICEAGTTIIGRKGNINSPVYCEGRFWNVDTAFGLAAKEDLDPKFLYYFCLSFDFSVLNRGTTIPSLVKSELLRVQLPVPPLAEQQRIVGILDEAFAGLATAKANAEKNLQNARALFESHLQSVFSQRGEGWVEKPLEAVSTIINGFAFKSTSFSANEGAKCIKITNVGVREFVSESGQFLPYDFAVKHKSFIVRPGNIVIALTRTIISGGLKVAVVPADYDGALLNQRVASIVPNENVVDGEFLFAFLSTQAVVDYVKSRVNTLMQPNLSINDLRAMPIPFPSLSAQTEIVEQIGVLREETQRLTAIYTRKLAALEELKKALLHQAFSGEL